MDEECYPAISMNTATNGHHQFKYLQHHNTMNGGGGFPKLLSGGGIESNTARHHQYLNMIQNGNSNDSESSSYVSDEIDIDDSTIKEEPMSPDSSCPPSPTLESNNNNTRSKNKNLMKFNNNTNNNNLNLSQVAALTNSDLVFEHKVRRRILMKLAQF